MFARKHNLTNFLNFVAKVIPHPLELSLAPEEVSQCLRARDGFVWLDSSNYLESGRPARSLLTARPEAVLTGHISDVSLLREALNSLPAQRAVDLGLPMGGLFGFVEFSGRFCFGLYPHVLIYDHSTQRWIEVGTISEAFETGIQVCDTIPALDFASQMQREQFIHIIRRAIDYIAAGDIYQVNLAQQFLSAWPPGADAFRFYQRLRHFSPAPHAAFLDLGGKQVLSASPELFLRMSGRTIITRPIKGTRPRKREPQEDERSAYELLTSAKEIAELIMITDLERNDLGQVCDYGTVLVPELLKLQRFEQVFHLSSTVQGTLRSDVDHLAALQACFPGGSISGAPKRRALEVIAELETTQRGLYTGAIGYIGAGGESQFNIAIRTAVAEEDRMHFHTGAGIVSDSVPDREYEETWDKAASILGAVAWRP
ncbi:MAG: anthranilate synthase component I family protein [Verrucomicrobiales bacterium]